MNLNKRKLAGHGRKNFKQADRINFANTKLSLIQDLLKKAKDTNLKGRFFFINSRMDVNKGHNRRRAPHFYSSL